MVNIPYINHILEIQAVRRPSFLDPSASGEVGSL
jgi:hypothetical protein